MESRKYVKIKIWGAWGFNGKVQQVSKILSQDLSLVKEQMIFVKGDFRELTVEVVINGQTTTVISRKGSGFFTATTPVEIAEALKSYL